MNPDLITIKSAIRQEIQQLAAKVGSDASALTDDDLIPASGVLDSAALIELITWYEEYLRVPIPQADLNIDNFGSVQLMAEYGSAKLAS